MSILIDKLLKQDREARTTVHDLIKGRWYVSKPRQYERQALSFVQRVSDAWRVFRCRSFAVHFARDARETLPSYMETAGDDYPQKIVQPRKD